MRIGIVTPGSLGSNPRVVKEATALHDAGHEVHVICSKTLPRIEFRDQDVLSMATWRSKRINLNGRSRYRFERVLQLVAKSVFRVLPLSHLADHSSSVFTRSLTKYSVAFSADLYIAHYPAALPAAAKAAKRHNAVYAFDAEDFHLGDLPDAPEHALDKSIIRAIEGRYLPGCTYVTAASPGIAEAYANAYEIPKPTTVLNVFPLSQAPAGPSPRGSASPGPSVYWFSQTIGPARGLECTVRAIARAKSRPNLYLRGTLAAGFGDNLSEIARENGVAERLHFLPPAAPSEMERLAAAYDIGLASDTGYSPSRQVALTNKLFSYLLAGIPVLMSDISAHRGIASELGIAARIYAVDDPQALADAIDSLLIDPAALALARSHAWSLGQTRFNWDLEQIELLAIVDAMNEPFSGAILGASLGEG